MGTEADPHARFLLHPEDVQNALRDALADPSLRLLYRAGDDYVGINGVPQPVLPRLIPASPR